MLLGLWPSLTTSRRPGPLENGCVPEETHHFPRAFPEVLQCLCVIVIRDSVIRYASPCPQHFGRRHSLRLYVGSDVWRPQRGRASCTRFPRGRCCSSVGPKQCVGFGTVECSLGVCCVYVGAEGCVVGEWGKGVQFSLVDLACCSVWGTDHCLRAGAERRWCRG